VHDGVKLLTVGLFDGSVAPMTVIGEPQLYAHSDGGLGIIAKERLGVQSLSWMGIVPRRGSSAGHVVRWSQAQVTIVDTPGNRRLLVDWLVARRNGRAYQAARGIGSLYPDDRLPELSPIGWFVATPDELVAGTRLLVANSGTGSFEVAVVAGDPSSDGVYLRFEREQRWHSFTYLGIKPDASDRWSVQRFALVDSALNRRGAADWFDQRENSKAAARLGVA